MLITTVLLSGLALLPPPASAWQPWPEHWLTDNIAQVPLTEVCQSSNLTAFEMAKGRQVVEFGTDPMESFEKPKVPTLNSTAGEQWEFDGVSEDGMQSFVFGFYRDYNYAILGTGNFRLSIEFAFADRTRFYEVYYPSRSVVDHCSVGTRGQWTDEKDGYSFSFLVKADMSEAIVVLDSPTVKGTVGMKSRARPLTADGKVWPAQNASTEAVPFYHWSEPIPAGDVEVDVVIRDTPLVWRGMGGHERFWSAFSWFTCLTNLNAVRAMLGPYVLSYFSFTSNIKTGETSQSVVLFKDGIPVFRSLRAEPSDTEDYALITKTYGGAVTGTLKDKVTGHQLELVSPTNAQHYTFFVEHLNLGFEYILGEGVGGSGFSAVSRGGHVGLSQYQGIALTEALTFPKNSPLFRSNYVE
ncbi:hypothetical protein FE257_010720 [Aspergillus nanangensis]|uniref:Diels-Alderase ccsF n=1 Tax=Aspergillus nanangensis TaxID=2582783 RepID=A0AAD4GR26_ASPNN|nr:hypothetical protein FE257_010720 [Aspergillus nanangensis]